jgi:hypothetical protein
MTDLSLKTGIYMRPLSKKEAAVAIVDTLLEFYAENGVMQPRVDLALLSLRHAPRHVNGMLHLAAAYGWMAEVSYMFDYNSPDPRMTLKERLKYQELNRHTLSGSRAASTPTHTVMETRSAIRIRRASLFRSSLALGSALDWSTGPTLARAQLTSC